MNVNKVMLLGTLTRDPAIRAAGQSQLCEFGLAINRKWKSSGGESKEEVCFVDIKAWGKTAETLNQYLQKGSKVFIEGRLCFETWEDKTTHAKRAKHTVVVENFAFVGERKRQEPVAAEQDGW